MKRLTKDGMPDAAYTIATWMDGSQYGFSRNLAKSFVLYEVAAKGGIRDAVYKMGLYYETIGDHANALKCIKKASEQGIVHATLVSFFFIRPSLLFSSFFFKCRNSQRSIFMANSLSDKT